MHVKPAARRKSSSHWRLAYPRDISHSWSKMSASRRYRLLSVSQPRSAYLWMIWQQVLRNVVR